MPRSSTGPDIHLVQAMEALKKANSYCQSGMDSALDIASEYSEKEQPDAVEKLKNTMQGFIELQTDLTAFINAAQSAVDLASGSAEELRTFDLDAKYQKNLKTNVKRKAKQHPAFVDLCEKVQDDPEPSTSGAESSVRGADRSRRVSSDAEISVSEAQRSTKCPITGAQMKQPVRSTICGHSFDQAGIMQYIKNCKAKHRPARCPIPGCSSKQAISSDLLTEDRQLKKYIDKKN